MRCFPIQIYAGATINPGYCTVRLFLFGWLKRQLEWSEYNGENGLYETVNGILTGLLIEMIETVFINWVNRFQRLIDENGGYVSQNATIGFLN
jgi:hypothetical protein